MSKALAAALLAALATTAAGQVIPRVEGQQDGDRLAAPGDVITAVQYRDGDALRALSGRIVADGATLAERVDSFVTRYGHLFGGDADADVRVDTTPVRYGRAVRVRQRVHGFDLRGHGLVVRFDDEGRVVHAHGVIAADTGAVPAPRLDAQTALRRAFELTDFDPDGVAGSPAVHPVARVEADGIHLLYAVDVVDGVMPSTIEIDADDGSLLGVHRNAVDDASFPLDGEAIPFDTGKGKGLVYKKMVQATAGKEGKSKLVDLTYDDIDPFVAIDGMLTGRYAYVLDVTGLAPVDPSHKFLFPDDDLSLFEGFFPVYQLFDHTNTYYWMTRMGGFFSDLLGDFAGDRPVLAYVNYDDDGAGYVNAFYSPSDPDDEGSGLDPGYFVFGEFSGLTGDPMDDLSRDPSIVCHEYTHMVVDKEGFSFGDADLDTPPRAVNEALADYASATYLKHPRIGSALVANGSEVDFGGDELRDLAGSQTMDDLFDQLGLTGLPEEHWVGGIFGAALWSARDALKAKTADPAILGSLADWPLSTAEVGFPVIDTGNVAAATLAYFHACMEAVADSLLLDAKKGPRNVGKLVGGFLAHGITGDPDGPVYALDATAGLKTVVPSCFLGGVDTHLLDLELAEGQTLTVRVKGRKGTTVDFAFDAGAGDSEAPGDFLFPKPKKANAKQTKAVQAGIEVTASRTYRLTVSNPDGLGGDYVLVIKAQQQ